MQDQVLPPFAAPTGPSHDDRTVAEAFARGEYAGHSPRFHVEGPALMVDRLDTAALRIGAATVLVRSDLADAQLSARPAIEQALTVAGLVLLDRDTLLAAPIAIQVLGLRLSSWDLWGRDVEEAFECLRTGAAGDF